METTSTGVGRTPYELPRQPLTVFQERLPTNDGQLHILLPAGVGDNLWVMSKHWKTCEERDVTFWLPEQEQKRGLDIFRMMGLRAGYMPGLSTDWVWSRPGQPPIPDTGAVISMHPNKHLDNGHRIEKWYPEIPFRNPIEFMDIKTALFKNEAGGSGYVVGFMSQIQYMDYGGNIKPAQWARIWRMMERDHGPVVLIAAGKDVPFAEDVMKIWDPTLAPVFNPPLETVAALIKGSRMMIGAHAGPLILSTYMGIPTYHAYPRNLQPMPGSWEHEGAVWEI